MVVWLVGLLRGPQINEFLHKKLRRLSSCLVWLGAHFYYVLVPFQFTIQLSSAGLNLCRNCLTASYTTSQCSFKLKYLTYSTNTAGFCSPHVMPGFQGIPELLKLEGRSRDNGSWPYEKVAWKSIQMRFHNVGLQQNQRRSNMFCPINTLTLLLPNQQFG